MVNIELTYTGACVQGGKPPCTCNCPVNFDIRLFIEKLKAGNFDAAYREYANKVIFPSIVSRICDEPCMSKCPAKVSLKRLERACTEYAKKKDPLKFNLPPRKGSVAIIGGGLSGLACAYRLAVRKYQVTVYESTEKIGGSLYEILDAGVIDEEFRRQLQNVNIEYKLNETVAFIRPEDLVAHAVYIATGKGGADFGLLRGWNPDSMATTRDGVFLGGKLTGAADMSAFMQGMIAAASIEKYLKIRNMSGQPESFVITDCILPELPSSLNCETIFPHNREIYTEEEAAAEAGRCIKCDCTACRDGCEFLKYFGMFPKIVERDTMMSRTALDGLLERVGTRMIVSCSLCGHCKTVCPKDINVEDVLTQGKQDLFEAGKFPPPFHDFYLRDMKLCMNEAFLAKSAPGFEKAGHAFFPGCQATASGTAHVDKAYRYMLSKHADTALIMACCGIPALWAGDKQLFTEVQNKLKAVWEELGRPILVTACPSCAKVFVKYMPEAKCISLYEFILDNGAPEGSLPLNGEYAVFDPCSSSGFADMQNAVRQLAEQNGARLSELPDSGKTARCCGMGGHIYPANPEVAKNMLKKAAAQSDLPYITYCANCRNLFLKAKKKCIHILDSVLSEVPIEKPFHISELKKNRMQLKSELLKSLWQEESESMEREYSVKLKISEELYDKMDKLHISEEDAYETVEYCEQNGETVTDKKTGILAGHLKIGMITYWVEYKKQGGEIELLNIYSHRVVIT